MRVPGHSVTALRGTAVKAALAVRQPGQRRPPREAALEMGRLLSNPVTVQTRVRRIPQTGKARSTRESGSLTYVWYRIPDAREIRVKRANLTRLTRIGQHGAHGAIP